MTGVLDGIRVLDFGRYIAGPFCACLLGDLGAEVIRVERVDGSEDRFLGPLLDDDASAMFLHVNRNKRGLTLNPMKPQGAQIVRQLVETADVVLANMPTAGLERVGLDWPTVSAINPKAVLTTVNAMGEGGPWSDRVGFDGIGQVMSGSTFLSGRPGDPMKGYVPWVDFGTASMAALGTVSALHERQTTGKGQHVTAALLQTALTFSNYTHIEQAVNKVDREASANRHQLAGPADIVPTLDGHVIVQAIGPTLFRRFCEMIERPELVEDPRFATDTDRGENGEAISAILAGWTVERSTTEVLDACAVASVPAGPVLSPQQVLENEHVAGLGFLEPVDYPGLPTPAPMARTPFGLSDNPPGIRHRAPTLGEHTDEILAELGFDAAAIADLRSQRVV
ncbi:MAG: CoA transferase [Actinomycetia bacterium]|nr:CoA transferase [Actinomycetes bacterium]MCP3912073.1 CoA transferase [Actinomycetes bacterium]MCP4086376.1 CoA transferase [Actinomycetes bacterium]